MKTTAGRALSNSRPPVATNTSAPLTESFMASNLLRDAQRLSEIVDDVLCRLDADRQPHQLLADAGGFELRRVHLLMRGAGGMNDQRLGGAHIGEKGDHPTRFDRTGAAPAPPPRVAKHD